MQTPQSSDDESAETVTQTSAEALRGLVEQAALNLLRQSPSIDFWQDSISQSLSDYQIAGWLGLPKDHAYQTRSLVAAVKRGGKSYKSFEVKINPEHQHGADVLVVSVLLNDEFEWRDAWEEAWKLAPHPNPHCLSD